MKRNQMAICLLAKFNFLIETLIRSLESQFGSLLEGFNTPAKLSSNFAPKSAMRKLACRN